MAQNLLEIPRLLGFTRGPYLLASQLRRARPALAGGGKNMITADLAKTIREEQAALERVLDDLRRETAVIPRHNISPWIDRVRGRFEHFRAHMIKHMALEEDEGYLIPVLQKRPALTETVERLHHEHGELMRLMDDVYASLADVSARDRLRVRDFCDRAGSLLSYIEHHEHEENLLLLDGVTRDFGTKD